MVSLSNHELAAVSASIVSPADRQPLRQDVR
jgi:hypothetical protein